MVREVKVHHPMSREAVRVLGQMIMLRRHELQIGRAEFSRRAGCSPRTVAAVESGITSVAIGTVFDLAAAAGIDLFGDGEVPVSFQRRKNDDALALLPSRVVTTKPAEVDLDF